MKTSVHAVATMSAAASAVPWVGAIALSGHGPLSLLRTPGLRAVVTLDAQVFDAVLMTIAAPVLGAAVAHARGGSGRHAWKALALAVASYVTAGFAVAVLASRRSALDATVLLQNRIAAAAVALALVSLGALCAARFDDVIDAVGAALATTMVAAFGVLAAGPAVDAWPERAINAGLLTSPLVAVTAAARIDLVRSPALYQLSAIAHRRFDYPEWWMATIVYLVVAGCCVAGCAIRTEPCRPERSR